MFDFGNTFNTLLFHFNKKTKNNWKINNHKSENKSDIINDENIRKKMNLKNKKVFSKSQK